MATTAVVELQAGTRRAVVRSERFMEWQRELSSTRASYGGRKRHDDNECVEASAAKKYCVKSDEDVAAADAATARPVKREASEERDGDVGGARAADTDAADAGKAKKQQQQKKRLNGKKHRNVEQKQGLHGSSKECAEADGGRMRRCKQHGNGQSPQKRQQQEQQSQQVPQHTNSNPATRRTQRRLPRSFSPPKEHPERSFRNRSSGTISPPPVLATSKISKRSKRVAQRLANEEPPPPPLKLPKLHLVLTRKEIQEDWMKITGHKYTGKPKKSTLIQRGFGLCTSLTCPSSIRYLNDPQCKLPFTSCFQDAFERFSWVFGAACRTCWRGKAIIYLYMYLVEEEQQGFVHY